MQFNAQTLKSLVKREALCRQMHKDKLHIVAFQEHRLRETGIVLCEGYLFAQSACTPAGFGGCCVAFSTTLPFGQVDGKNEKITVDDISLLHTDPRRIIVKVNTVCFQGVCMSLHAEDVSEEANNLVLLRLGGTTRKHWRCVTVHLGKM